MEERSNVPAIAAGYGSGAAFSLGVPSTHEMMAYQTYAKTAVDSQMYRGVGKEAGVMMIMLAAREYGIGPAQALNGGLNIIEGKVELSARIMGAMIRRAGHTIKILEDSDTKCTIYGRRGDTGEEYTVTYTIEQAQRAGLIKDKGGWRKVPDDMLFARAQSKLARRLYSDVIGIGYVQGEITLESPPQSHQMSIDMPVEIEPEVVNVNEEDLQEELLQSLDKPEDQFRMIAFIQAVMETQKWDRIKTLKEMLKDTNRTFKRFQEWKDKTSSLGL